jgi:hypothetical protein
MTKSTSPPANAGLPAIDRRSLVCSLGTAAIAGTPAFAGAASKTDDPVFQALAALKQLKIHANETDAAHSVAEDAFFATDVGVTLDGKEMRTHKQIDAHFTPFCNEEEFNKILGRIEILRPRRLADAERVERDMARQAAHDGLTRKEVAIEQRIGLQEIEARKESAEDAVWDAEYEVMEAKPTTPAGAITLLRFVAELMEGFFADDDEHEHYVAAIRNAADFFEMA